MNKIIALLVFLVIANVDALGDELRWKAPDSRENGERIDLHEIGGYELRALDESGNKIWEQIIDDRNKTSLKIPLVIDAAVFEICVYDTDGLYSEWVKITPKPEPPGQGWLEPQGQGWLE